MVVEWLCPGLRPTRSNRPRLLHCKVILLDEHELLQDVLVSLTLVLEDVEDFSNSLASSLSSLLYIFPNYAKYNISEMRKRGVTFLRKIVPGYFPAATQRSHTLGDIIVLLMYNNVAEKHSRSSREIRVVRNTVVSYI